MARIMDFKMVGFGLILELKGAGVPLIMDFKGVRDSRVVVTIWALAVVVIQALPFPLRPLRPGWTSASNGSTKYAPNTSRPHTPSIIA
ncbi:unnamed protein product [Oppiella nova]|uniref:Uncharacterized protein n=1 Tax=Oppiella nova TaxID=334625 RepID=A0A7R9MI15_9ACAR|nr:unnamed protein product [Oppiella nova]CAG2177741.1 unnamed protein product [Oppiella nova]